MPFRRKTTTCAGMCSQSFKINRRGRLQWAGRGGGGPSRRSQPGPRSRDCEGAGGADSPGPVVRSQNRVAHPAFRGVTTGNSPQLLSRKVLTRGGGSNTHFAATVFYTAV